MKHFGLIELGGLWEDQTMCVRFCCRQTSRRFFNISAEVSRKAQSELSVCTGFDQGARPTGRQASGDRLRTRPGLT